MKKTVNTIASVVLCIAISVLTVTFSIGLPIYFRPFYYMQIEDLRIPARTGQSYEVIKEAFDELLDYLTLPGREFGTGVFPYSESGESHFADCKLLFDLNAWAFIIALGCILLVVILSKKKIVRLSEVGGFGIPFVSGVCTLCVFLLLGIIVSVDFDRAFTVFHYIFFPGKYDWYFDPFTDGIIMALPETFFMRCAVLIGASIIIISLLTVSLGVYKRKKQKNKRRI